MKLTNRRAFLKRSGLLVVFSLPLPWLTRRGRDPAASRTDFQDLLGPRTATAPTAYELQTPHQVLQMDLAASDYDARFIQLTNQSYRPIWLQGSTNGAGAATYSAIWVRDGAWPWNEWRDMSAASYQTYFNTYAAQGYRPISVSGFQNSGVNQFAAVWLAASATYHGIDNYTNAQYQAWVNTQVSNGFMPQVVDGYAVGTDPTVDNYISVWADVPAYPLEARHGLTSAGYQSFVSTYAAQGYHVTCVSAYQINGTTYFAAYMVKDALTDWIARHDTVPAALISQAVTFEQTDYQPIVIEGYDTGSTRNFAGVWIKKARAWTTTGDYNADLAVFDNAIQTYMQARNIPGGALAVTRNSRLVYARGYRWDGYNVDPVKPDSLFRIASLTKQLTSMAIMRLVQLGTLHLTDHLTTLLTLPAPKDSRMNDITLLDLLQHLGGWNRDTTGFDPMFEDQFIAAKMSVSLPISQWNIIDYMTTQRNLDFAPGTLMDYSNYGYLLLGRIIEAVTGQPYAKHMQDHILGPLGITRIVQGASEFEYRHAGEVPYFQSYPGLYPNVRHAGAPVNVMGPYGSFNIENMDSHGGYLATAVDLARFATAFDSTGLYPVLTQATIDQVFAVPGVGISPDGSWYGCGWYVRYAGSGINTYHTGSLPGTTTLIVRRFDGLDWVALFNQRDDPSGLDYSVIDQALETAASAVTHWPSGDLFPSYGLPSTLYKYWAFLTLIVK